MGQPAAKMGDQVQGTDTHLVIPPSGGPPAPAPLPFAGILNAGLSADVTIMGQPAATADSMADNTPPHLPPGGGAFQRPPSNKGRIQMGSATVLINGKPAARNGDPVLTCNDPQDAPVGTVMAAGTVNIGG